jgi:hypothetical protein
LVVSSAARRPRALAVARCVSAAAVRSSRSSLVVAGSGKIPAGSTSGAPAYAPRVSAAVAAGVVAAAIRRISPSARTASTSSARTRAGTVASIAAATMLSDVFAQNAPNPPLCTSAAGVVLNACVNA